MHFREIMKNAEETDRTVEKTAEPNSSINSRIFVKDQNTKIRFLVDTRVDVCIFPRLKTTNYTRKSDYTLYAANGTKLVTYGDEIIAFNLCLCRTFSWRFIIANVKNFIIRMNFFT
jgi:hypothetical protein